jgi:hypothetical protein
VLRQLPARLGRISSTSGLKRPTKCTDSGSSVTATAPTAATIAVVKRLHHFGAGRRFSRLGPERFDALQVQSPPPGELEKTIHARQSIEGLVANSGEENTTKFTERRGPPLSYLVLSTTSEAQLRTKYEQSSIRDARIILQNYPRDALASLSRITGAFN